MRALSKASILPLTPRPTQGQQAPVPELPKTIPSSQTLQTHHWIRHCPSARQDLDPLTRTQAPVSPLPGSLHKTLVQPHPGEQTSQVKGTCTSLSDFQWHLSPPYCDAYYAAGAVAMHSVPTMGWTLCAFFPSRLFICPDIVLETSHVFSLFKN